MKDRESVSRCESNECVGIGEGKSECESTNNLNSMVD